MVNRDKALSKQLVSESCFKSRNSQICIRSVHHCDLIQFISLVIFVCDSFNDSFNISEYIESNYRMIYE
jgi:hypothetical protein